MKRFWCIVLAVAGPVGAAVAQEDPEAVIGSRVRVTTPETRVVGTLESLGGGTIVVSSPGGTSVELPLARASVEVSRGPGLCSGGRRGACVVIGVVAGAAVGFGAGKFAESKCDFCGGKVYPWTMLGGAVAGGTVGALIGGEHWRVLALPGGTSLAPPARGAAGGGRSYAVTMSVAF